MTTVVLGLGNVLLSDEGIGVKSVERMVADPRVPADVTLIDGGTLGLELLSCAAGAERMLVLDTVDVDAAPGTVVRITREDLGATPGGGSVHQLGVTDLLSALRLMGAEPSEVVILGVQPESLALGTTLSPAVAAALETVVEEAIGQLLAWNRAIGDETHA